MLSRLAQRRRWMTPKDLTRKSSILLSILLVTMCGCSRECGIPYIPLGTKPQVTEQEPVKTPVRPTPDIRTEIQIALENGDYERILNDPKLRNLFFEQFEQNTKPIKAEMEFRFLRKLFHRGVGEQDTVLTKDTPYRLVVKVFGLCYLYIFRYDSSGRLHQLFPNADVSSFSNPVELRATEEFRVIPLPGHDTPWFRLEDNKPGIETIYLIASRWQQKRLEGLLKAAELENSQQAIVEILALMRKADEYTARIGGLAFYSYSFQHASSSSGAEQ